MELQQNLLILAEKIKTMKEQITTEEATKTAFVLPFINSLGYDIFNPLEVIPEFTADVGTKKGEKVDYAIFQEGVPILIIECKHWRENLDNHDSQLYRYFAVTKTRFALLTNGIQFRFYTDLEKNNIMDKKPFLDFDVTNLKDQLVIEIAKFHKSNFDVNRIVNNASSLKYIKEIRSIFKGEMENPSEAFVRIFTSQIYSGRLTEKVLAQFTELVKKAVTQTFKDEINDRLQHAINSEAEEQEIIIEEIEESKVNTTEEEMEGYRIVIAILRKHIEKSRITFRDTQSYFGVLLDDNNRKPICRLHLDRSKKYIGIFDENKNESKHQIDSVDDIYNFEEALLKTACQY